MHKESVLFHVSYCNKQQNVKLEGNMATGDIPIRSSDLFLPYMKSYLIEGNATMTKNLCGFQSGSHNKDMEDRLAE
jgi:hypothetical protein